MVKLLSKFWKRYLCQFKVVTDLAPHMVARGQQARTYVRLTTSFFVTLALCLSFYFIASNIGSGWIYLLSTSLFVALCLGLVLPLIELTGLQALQGAPKHCVTGQPATIRLELTKTKGWPHLLPVQWFTLSYKQPKHSCVRGNSKLRPYHVECLNTNQYWLWTTPPLIRGVHPAGQIVLTTSFPFGLASWVKEVPAPEHDTITVYPKVVPIEGFIFFRLRSGSVARGGFSRNTQAVRQSTSTRGLREYVRGDSPRHVHWASSARAGRLLVREFEAEGLPCFDVALNLAAPWTSSDQFELAVTTASSFLSAGHKLGMGTELILSPDISQLPLTLPPTLPGLVSQMEILARVKPCAPPKDNALPVHSSYSPPSQDRILLAICPAGYGAVLNPACYLIEVGHKSPSLQGSKSTSSYDPGLSGLMRSTITKEEDLMEL